ncbi:DUF58 domain-containing protein [Coralliovum pocilloporae]|uniref:DUF58 domain-containing protein n=1 Tax=Coralliovum pocilloporae TaxID=3066369 RepID=UPI0033072D37
MSQGAAQHLSQMQAIENRTLDNAVRLSKRLPQLVIRARQLATSFSQGWHGRRQTGIGTEFWQYRPYSFGESRRRIDWRRTARDDVAIVREREWAASHTIWLWCDLGPSMYYGSSLADESKAERALLLLLALAELLSASGETIGLVGHKTFGFKNRGAERLAGVLNARALSPLPLMLPSNARRHSDLILISDFLEPADRLSQTLSPFISKGMHISALQVLDPSEESFPFSGRVHFLDPGGANPHEVQRAELIKATYQARLVAHRQSVDQILRKSGRRLQCHHTDRSASTPIQAILNQIEAGRSA